MKLKRVVMPIGLVVMLFMALGGIAAHANGPFPLDIRYSASVLQEGVIERGVIHMDIRYTGEDPIDHAKLMIENMPQLILIEGEITLESISPDEPISFSAIYELDRSGSETLSLGNIRWLLTYEDPVDGAKIEVIQGKTDDAM